MSNKLFSYLYGVNTFLHFANFSTFALGVINYQYFSENKKTDFTNLSLKNLPIILLDSFPIKNTNKYRFIIPSALAKIFILSEYYKIFLAALINKNTLLSKHDSNDFEINKEKLTEKERIELGLVEDKSSKIVKLYEIRRRQNFLDDEFSKDKYSLFIQENQKILNNLLNASLIATILIHLPYLF